MPSPIGHALAGAAIAWGAERRTAAAIGASAGTSAPRLQRADWTLTLVCAGLAAVPDADLLVSGLHRTVTHSVLAAGLVTILAAGVTGWVTGRIRWGVAAVCGAAYASHLLLDWLGADPNLPSGIQLLWPDRRWFIAPLTIFPGTERRHLFTLASIATNVKAAAVECAVLGPIAVVLGRERLRAVFRRRYRSRVPTSGQDGRLRPSAAEAGRDGT
jgi:membrane-bound metal-dependent hydrolase YbcI (DUF457 family)